MINPAELAERFRLKFQSEPQIYRAPGRVNLMGDHTDYNDGFVLPAAIDFYCWAAISARNDGAYVIFPENLQETVAIKSGEISRKEIPAWARYPVGVIQQLRNSGYDVCGANLYFASGVPMGAGLSSSAAIEVATAYGLLGVSGQHADPSLIAKLCQKAENDFVGTQCGIMDQFASCHGVAGHALLLDCRSLGYRAVAIPDRIRLVICNTMVRRELASSRSEYNARRAECEEGVRQLKEVLPHIRALRDVTLADLEKHRDRLTNTVYKRCRHVITENERVGALASALESDEFDQIKSLMQQSHASLRDDYEVSCPELDLLVSLASQQDGVYGTRMTGAGFGGCTVNLVDSKHVSDFRRRIADAYFKEAGRRPEIYVCAASEGAGRVFVSGENSR
jgi:galactokinase